MAARHHGFLHTAREFVTHWSVAGAILAITGAAPEHWFAHFAEKLSLPLEILPPWLHHGDLRLMIVAAGVAIIVGDTLWRHHAPQPHAPEHAAVVPAAVPDKPHVLPLPDKPSIAVLPFTNLSGDPAQEYFSDGITEDIITGLSRFRALFVIARNSTFTYKGKPTDVRQVARELGVHYVIEGSARKVGNRARVSAQLIDAVTGSHLWAENYDRTLEDVFALQEDVTRGIVTAVAPEVELAEITHARRVSPNDNALHFTWRAQGLMHDGVRKGQASLVLDAIGMARQAVAIDPTSLAAYNVLAWSYWSCHLYRWGPEPASALDAMWAAVEQMLRIDALDHRTLTICGVVRVIQGEPERGLADLRRAQEVNPNSSLSLMWLALCEAMAGSAEDARTHATLSLRLNPRDFWIGVAHLALAIVSFTEHDYADAQRWAALAIQAEPAVPFRRAIMVACCALNGDTDRAVRELGTLNGLAPDFVARLLRADLKLFKRPEDLAHLLDGLRLAGASG